MKTFFKWLVAIVVIAAVVLVMARDTVIKKTSRAAVLKATGFDLDIGAVDLGLFGSDFEIRDVRLINPEDFPEALAFDIRRAYVQYDVKSLFSDQVHLPAVDLDVPEIVVVIKDNGESNIVRLTNPARSHTGEPAVESEEGEPVTAAKETAEPGKSIRIDRLQLKIGRVVVRQYVKGQKKPEETVTELNIDKTYTGISGLHEVGVVIGTEVMANNMLKQVNETLKKYGGNVQAAGQELGNAVKNLFKKKDAGN